jgi:hypothetical protein
MAASRIESIRFSRLGVKYMSRLHCAIFSSIAAGLLGISGVAIAAPGGFGSAVPSTTPVAQAVRGGFGGGGGFGGHGFGGGGGGGFGGHGFGGGGSSFHSFNTGRSFGGGPSFRGFNGGHSYRGYNSFGHPHGPVRYSSRHDGHYDHNHGHHHHRHFVGVYGYYPYYDDYYYDDYGYDEGCYYSRRYRSWICPEY